MDSTIRDRIQAIMDGNRLNISNFSKEIGKSYTAIHTILKGNSKPSFDLLEAIMATYPRINPTWLLTGKGAMYEDAPGAAPEVPGSDSYLKEHMRALEENFARLASQLQTKDHQIEAKDTQIDRLTRMLESVLGKHEDTPSMGRVMPLWSEEKAVG